VEQPTHFEFVLNMKTASHWSYNSSLDLARRRPGDRIKVAALGYLAEDGAVAGRDLLGDEPQPGGEPCAPRRRSQRPGMPMRQGGRHAPKTAGRAKPRNLRRVDAFTSLCTSP